MDNISEDDLNQAALPVANFEQCKNDYITFGIKLESEQHLCAGFAHGGVDACQEMIYIFKAEFNIIRFCEIVIIGLT
jgi:hypothetical protein